MFYAVKIELLIAGKSFWGAGALCKGWQKQEEKRDGCSGQCDGETEGH